jgi:hypothetical protein
MIFFSTFGDDLLTPANNLAPNAKLRCEIIPSPAEHATCVDISRRGAMQGLNNPRKSPILAKHSCA